MRILIIGGSSTIGRALVVKLRPQAVVMTAGRRESDFLFDLTQWEYEPAIDGVFDVVIHVAADFGGGANDDFVRAELVNAVGTLSACRLAQCVQAKHFILLSTISATYRPGEPHYGIYALSKRHGEEVAGFFCAEHGMALTILRPSQVYDAEGCCRRHQALLYTMADRAQAGQDFHIYGSHDVRRNYLYLEDLVEVCRRVVQGRHTGVFTCAHPQSVRLSEAADAAFAAFGRGGKVQFMKDKPDLADLPFVNDDTLYREINYWPVVDIGEGLRRIKQRRENNT